MQCGTPVEEKKSMGSDLDLPTSIKTRVAPAGPRISLLWGPSGRTYLSPAYREIARREPPPATRCRAVGLFSPKSRGDGLLQRWVALVRTVPTSGGEAFKDQTRGLDPGAAWSQSHNLESRFGSERFDPVVVRTVLRTHNITGRDAPNQTAWDVGSSINSTLEHKIDALRMDIIHLHEDHKKLKDCVATTESTASELCLTIVDTTMHIKDLQKEVLHLRQRLEDQEGRSSSNNIRMVGLPEHEEGPSLDV
ncbi:hypothetical protein NDU88_005803 [Pleurodeles waltl]|uniref:Tektin n=1 Tax=Pleurodeles waltl TaxID=8319 RepID=A0AAV7X1S4_PLEWA|nr:hypothetical protein NDU88_005803 [Pleurodeles waltl]